MKTRSGFVSNSSTSSFLLIGVRADDMEWDDVPEGLDSLSGCEDGLDDGERVIGVKLGNWADDDGGSISLKELTSAVEKIGTTITDVTLSDIKLYFGTRMC